MLPHGATSDSGGKAASILPDLLPQPNSTTTWVG
jgi:hypothetical protein